jgi:hypothetical protein
MALQMKLIRLFVAPKRPGCPRFVPESDNNPTEYRPKVPNTSDGRQTSHEPPNHLDQALGGDEYKTSVIPSNPVARIGVLSSDPLPSPQITSSNRFDGTRNARSSVVQLSRHPYQKAYNNSIMGEGENTRPAQSNALRQHNFQAAQGNADHTSYPNTTIVTTNPECQGLDLKTLSDLSGTSREYSPPLQRWQPAERPILEHDSHSAHGDFSNV